jgi:hypothetical protein
MITKLNIKNKKIKLINKNKKIIKLLNLVYICI